MTMVDGSLGLAGVEDYSSLNLWSRKVNSEGGEMRNGYYICRVIKLETVMPTAHLRDGACVVGFADGVDVMFLSTDAGLFTIQLKSGRVRMVDEYDARLNFSVLPYT
jgi:hypothetical protein